MRHKKTRLFLIAVCIIGCLSAAGFDARARDSKELSNEEVRALANEAYIYAFPMLEFYRIEYLRGVWGRSFNQMTHSRNLKTPQDRSVVKPNNDTLYSVINLDLRAEPYILEVPAIRDRYYSFQLIDAFTHVPGFIGTRATGTGEGKYVIAGPLWKEKPLPGIAGIFRMESEGVMIVGRTAVNGPGDLAAAHAVQDRYKLYPLSEYTKEAAPAAPDIVFPVVDAAYPMNFNLRIWRIPGAPPLNTRLPASPPYKELSAAFITYLNFQLGRIKPAPGEKEMLARLAAIGIGPNRPFDPDTLDPVKRNAIDLGIADARKEITQELMRAKSVNGWKTALNTFGDRSRMEGRYARRAAGALVGLFGNPAEEAAYPSTDEDSEGRKLDGASNRYVMTFAPGRLPPTLPLGFWSLTLYNADGFLVDNAAGRYAISSLDKGYEFNPDGSLSLYIQADPPPAGKLANWLPAPKGPFNLTLRIYLPADSVLRETWSPPPVVRIRS